MQQIDWIRIAPEVAKQLLGEPSKTSSNELRWGNKGSMVLNKEEGTFYDHEAGVGGGVIDLIKHLNQDINTVLKQFGYDLALHSNDSLLSGFNPPKIKTTSNARSFTREQMIDLYKDSIVSLKYSNNFIVLRFPEGHAIKQKYAPFTLGADGLWHLKRPESPLMPIYYTDKYPTKPIVVNEGEKALKGCEAIIGDTLDSCTWHGGVNSWKKADWSPILKRDVWIFPDNDKAGTDCAEELAEHLRKKGCRSIKIIKPPKRFQDKDDLYDAYDRGDFKSADHFIRYANLQKQKLPAGALRFQRADYVISQVTNPDWLITDVFERNRLITVFGEPKSGKSFIAIAMACAVARGTDFYGHTAKKAPVVYLAGEGLAGVRRRLSAANQYFKKIDPTEEDEGLKDVPLFLSNRGSRINEADEYEKLVDEINLLKEQEKQIGLIIFDTFQRNFSGDENSAQEVNKFVKAADQLIHDFDCTVLLVHHTGRGNKGRARGSSVLDASIDGEFLVERKDKTIDGEEKMLVKIKQTKNKDGMGMAEKNFEFHEERIIGEGLDVTSGLLIETDSEIESDEETQSKIDHIVDKKIVGLMYSLALDEEKPEEKWFTHSTFKHHAVFNGSGKPIGRDNTNNAFARLEKAGIVVQAKRDENATTKQGYRLVDFRPYEDYELL
jgi:KaiC/GvpD/RAD55 family RecA-like ATPase